MAEYPPHHQSSSGGVNYPPSPASSTDDSSNSNPPPNPKLALATTSAALAGAGSSSSRSTGLSHYHPHGHHSNQYFQEQPPPSASASGFGSSAYGAHASYSSVYPSVTPTSTQRSSYRSPPPDSPVYPSQPPRAGPSWPYNHQQSSSSSVPQSPAVRPSSPKDITRSGWAPARPTPPAEEEVDQLRDDPAHQAPSHPELQQVRLESPSDSADEDESGPVTLTATAPYRPRPGYPISAALGRNPSARPHPLLSPSSSSKTYAFVSLPGNAMRKRPRRRYDEIDRLYHCNFEGCVKSYGTLNHLNAHVTMQGHGSKRTPGEFKEMRKEWRKRKKGPDVAHPQDDDDSSDPTAGPSGQAATSSSQTRARRRRRATESALPNIATLEGEGKPESDYGQMGAGSGSGPIYLGGLANNEANRRLSMDEYHLHSAMEGGNSANERRGSGGTELTQDLDHSDEEPPMSEANRAVHRPQRVVGMSSPSMMESSTSVTLSPLAIEPSHNVGLPRAITYWQQQAPSARNPMSPAIPSVSQMPGPGPSVQLSSTPNVHPRRSAYASPPAAAYGHSLPMQHPVAHQTHPSLAQVSMHYPQPPSLSQGQPPPMQSIPPVHPSLPTPPIRHEHALGLHHGSTPPQHTPTLAPYQGSPPPPPPPRLPQDSILFTPLDPANPHSRSSYQASALPEPNVPSYANPALPGAYEQERIPRDSSRGTPPHSQPLPPPQPGSWDGYRPGPLEPYPPPHVSRPYEPPLRGYRGPPRAPEQYAPYRQTEPSYQPQPQPVRRQMSSYTSDPYISPQQPPQRSESYASSVGPSSSSGPQYPQTTQRSESAQYEYARQEYSQQQPQVGYPSHPVQYQHPQSFPHHHHPGHHQLQHPPYQNQPQLLPPGHPSNTDPYGRGPPGPNDGNY